MKFFQPLALLFSMVSPCIYAATGSDNPFPKKCPVELQPSACVQSGSASASISTGDDPSGKSVPTLGRSVASVGNRTTHNLKVGREYKVNWQAPPATASLHMKFDTGNIPPGHQIEVNDGSGWRPGNRLDNTLANTPANPASSLYIDTSAVTMKVRISRQGTPAGHMAGPVMTKPIVITRPRQGAGNWGIEHVDGNDQDTAPDTKEPLARINYSLGFDVEGGKAVSAGFLDVEVPLIIECAEVAKDRGEYPSNRSASPHLFRHACRNEVCFINASYC